VRRSARIAALRQQSHVEHSDNGPTDSPTWRPHHGGLEAQHSVERDVGTREQAQAQRRQPVVLVVDSDSGEDDEVVAPAAEVKASVITLSDSSPDSVTLAASSQQGDSSFEGSSSESSDSFPSPARAFGLRSGASSSLCDNPGPSASGAGKMSARTGVEVGEPVRRSVAESTASTAAAGEFDFEERGFDEERPVQQLEQDGEPVLGEIKSEEDGVVAVKEEGDSDERLVPLAWRYALLSPSEYVSLTPPMSATGSSFDVKSEEVDSKASVIPLEAADNITLSASPRPLAGPASSSTLPYTVMQEDAEPTLTPRPAPVALSSDDFPYPDPPSPELALPPPPTALEPSTTPHVGQLDRPAFETSLAAGPSDVLLQNAADDSSLRAHGSADAAAAAEVDADEDVRRPEEASSSAGLVSNAHDEQDVGRTGLVVDDETEQAAAQALLILARRAEGEWCIVA